MPRPKIISVIGARPNFVKIASFIRCLERQPGVTSLLVHTGQHYDASLSDIFFEQLGIRAPDINLEVGSASHAQQTAAIMTGFEPILERERPDCVVVVGDVNSTLACSLTAKKMQIPIAHIEAGLRSGDDAMPEEINRRVTDLLSELFFTTSVEAGINLRRENVASDRIHFVGNLMIDSLFHNLERATALTTYKDYGLKSGHYALLTLHRPSNVDDAGLLRGLLQTFAQIHNQCPVLFVAHPRTRKVLVESKMVHESKPEQKTLVTPYFYLSSPVGYLEMLNLQMNARVVLTDSGGMQEETTVLKIPCLTLRETTERPETVTLGTNQVIGTRPEVILQKAREILGGQIKQGRIPDLWDGKTGERIVKILTGFLSA